MPETADWVIRKRGMFYRPNRAGYTLHIAEAGRYTRAEAEAEARIEPRNIFAAPAADFEKDDPVIALLYEVVDVTWGRAFEDQSVPATSTATEIIAEARRRLAGGRA